MPEIASRRISKRVRMLTLDEPAGSKALRLSNNPYATNFRHGKPRHDDGTRHSLILL